MSTATVLDGTYWRVWTAAVVSRFGDAVRIPAIALLAASFTRDPRAIAAVVVAGQLPPVLFSLLGGVFVDRWDRRRTMAAADTARTVLVAALALAVAAGLATGPAGIAALAACAFGLATLGTLFDASAFAVLPALVPADRLATANGRLQAGTTAAGGFVGAPAAGVLFAAASSLPFVVDAVTFAVAAILASTLPASGGTAVRSSIWREAGEGLRWLLREPTLRLVTTFSALSNIVISALQVLIVLLVLDVFGVPEAGYGLVVMVAAAGSLLGALGAARLSRWLGTLPALRAVLTVQALALAGIAVSRHPVSGTFALAVFTAGTGVWNTLAASYGQRLIPPDLLGRVGSAQRMAQLAAAPVGALLGGFFAARYGVAGVVLAGAVLFALLVALFTYISKR